MFWLGEVSSALASCRFLGDVGVVLDALLHGVKIAGVLEISNLMLFHRSTWCLVGVYFSNGSEVLDVTGALANSMELGGGL